MVLRFLKSRYFIIYTLICCWIATAFLGRNGFFLPDTYLTVSLVDITASNALTIFIATMVFLPAIIALFTDVTSSKWLLVTSLIFYTVLCTLDIHRLTQYMLIYYGLFFILTTVKYDTHIKMSAIIILLAGIYIFSGLHKLNTGFVEDIASRFWFHSLPFSYQPAFGYGFAVLELLAGLLLLIPLTRKLGIVILLFMHSLILWKLNPWKMDWNYIIFPWNICMMVLLLQVYIYSNRLKFKIGSGKYLFAGIFTFFWLIPATSDLVHLPENISMKLYSGKSLNGLYVTSKKIEDLQRYDKGILEDKMIISIQRWSMEERGIAFNADPWVYQQFIEQMKIKNHPEDRLHFGKSKELSLKLEK